MIIEYTVVRTVDLHNNKEASYGHGPFVLKIIYLKKGDKKIDIIVSRSNSAILPIFGFHSTVVMNIFTGKSLIAFYPDETVQDVSIVCRNPDAFSRANEHDRVTLALQKYADRDVSITRPGRNANGSINQHICEVDARCPHTLRHVDDHLCCTFTMGPEDQILDELRTAVWRFGGDPCFPGNRAFGALVVTDCGHVVHEFESYDVRHVSITFSYRY